MKRKRKEAFLTVVVFLAVGLLLSLGPPLFIYMKSEIQVTRGGTETTHQDSNEEEHNYTKEPDYTGHDGLENIDEIPDYWFDRGYQDGIDAGYSVGLDRAYAEVREHWYEEGFYDGKIKGYEEGYGEGKEHGYEEGRDDGRKEGYEEGYSDGYDDALKEAAP